MPTRHGHCASGRFRQPDPGNATNYDPVADRPYRDEFIRYSPDTGARGQDRSPDRPRQGEIAELYVSYTFLTNRFGPKDLKHDALPALRHISPLIAVPPDAHAAHAGTGG
jgi:hypothetical protein